MFRKRFLSNMIDMGILMIAIWFLGAIMMVLINTIGGAKLKPILWLFTAVCVLGPILKDVFLCNRSVGKKIMGLKIMTKDGNKPHFIQLIARNLFSLIWPVEAVLLLLDKERVGDKVAGTIVVECQ